MDLSLMDSSRWPYVVSAVGVLLGLIQVGEWFAISLGWFVLSPGFRIGALTSLPFIGGLVYGGYWLAESELPADQYHRVGHWMFLGLAGFLGLNVAIMVALPPDGVMNAISWLRWASALGGGIGLLIGVFEARAIHQALTAERARIRQEELRLQNEQLDEFASILSHDLRSPLNVAQGRLALAQEEVESEHHEAVARAHERMLELIDDLLTLAREGQLVGETEPVDLGDLTRSAWQSVETANATLMAETDVRIRADESRLRQLVENLFRNAIEHAGADVTISVVEMDDGFAIEDDGPGIPADERDQVLDPGFTSSSDGTGFGLAIVKQTAEAHGWEVTVTESGTGGARFEFTNVEFVR